MCLRVRLVISVCFEIGISYLADGSVTMSGCIAYIHDPDKTMTFDLKAKFIGFIETAGIV